MGDFPMNHSWLRPTWKVVGPCSPQLKSGRWVIFLILPVVVSCSVIQVGYSQLDRIFLWKLDRYFDLSDAQEEYIANELERLHAWHRQEELPRYIVFLEGIDRYVQDGLKPSEVESILVSIETFRVRLARETAPTGAQLLSTLTTRQIDYFQRVLEEDNTELEDEFGSDDLEQDQKRTDSVLNRLTSWVGRLSEDQTQDIEAWIRDFPDTTSPWLAHRRNRQAILIELVNSSTDPQALEPELSRWLASSTYGATGEYLMAWQNWRNGIKKFLLNLDEILTYEQRTHFSNELQEVIHDLRDLQ